MGGLALVIVLVSIPIALVRGGTTRHRITLLQLELQTVRDAIGSIGVAPVAAAEPAPTPLRLSVELPLPPVRRADVPLRSSAEIEAAPDVPAELGSTADRTRAAVDRLTAENPLVRLVAEAHAIVRIGVLVLLVGIGFLYRLASHEGWISPWLRIAVAGGVGLVLLAIAWRLLQTRRAYALALAGGGFGALFMTALAADRLYHLIPSLAALAAMVAVAIACALSAIKARARALALLALAGGLLAPVMTQVEAATGGLDDARSVGSLIAYFALLNLTMAVIVWVRPWRELPLLSLAGTAIFGLAWGVDSYHASLLVPVEIGLAVHLVIAIATTTRFADHLDRGDRTAAIDGSLVFGVPVAVLGLHLAVAGGRSTLIAITLGAAGATYLALAALLRRRGDARRTIRLAFLILGLGLTGLAVPYALESSVATGFVWMLEAVALIWFSLRTGSLVSRAFGLVGLTIGPIAALLDTGTVSSDQTAFASGIAAIAMLAAMEVTRRARFATSPLPLLELQQRVLGGSGLAFTVASATVFAREHVATPHQALFAVVCLGAVGALAECLQRRRGFGDAMILAISAGPAAIGAALVHLIWFHHVLAGSGVIAALVALAAHGELLRRNDSSPLAMAWHWLLAATPLAMLGEELAWQAHRHGAGHEVELLAIAGPVLVAAVGIVLATRANRWPVGSHSPLYPRWIGSSLATLGAVAGLIVGPVLSGSDHPVRYLPLLNPLDLLALAGGVVAVLYLRRERFAQRELATRVLAVAAFFATNAAIARGFHQLAGVEWDLSSLLGASSLQSVLSVIWSLAALTLMVVGARRRLVAPWLAGAVLLAATVAKLFLLDLATLAPVARIATFMGVGVLMLVIGYLAPAPPELRRRRPSPAPDGEQRPAD